MGLTGVILQATVAVQRTETAYFTVDTQRCTDLDDLMATMTDGDQSYTYSVAWFDAVTRGKHLGRAVLTRGNKAKITDLPAKLRTEPLQVRRTVVRHHPGGLPQPDGQPSHGQGVQ